MSLKSRSTRHPILDAANRLRVTPRSRTRVNTRMPLRKSVMTRNILQLRTDNLPFEPIMNERTYENRNFAYRGTNRNLRRRGYPNAEFRNITSQSSIKRRVRPISPVRAIFSNQGR